MMMSGLVPMSYRHFSLIGADGGNIGAADGPSSEAAAKASAKEFLNKVEEDLIIDEITSPDQWKTKVMEVTDKPIILDFSVIRPINLRYGAYGSHNCDSRRKHVPPWLY